MIALVNKELGYGPLSQESFRFVPEAVEKELADYGLLVGFGEEGTANTFSALRNKMTLVDAALVERGSKQISAEMVQGTLFAQWLRKQGYDSVRYEHPRGEGKTVTHIAILRPDWVDVSFEPIRNDKGRVVAFRRVEAEAPAKPEVPAEQPAPVEAAKPAEAVPAAKPEAEAKPKTYSSNYSAVGVSAVAVDDKLIFRKMGGKKYKPVLEIARDEWPSKPEEQKKFLADKFPTATQNERDYWQMGAVNALASQINATISAEKAAAKAAAKEIAKAAKAKGIQDKTADALGDVGGGGPGVPVPGNVGNAPAGSKGWQF